MPRRFLRRRKARATLACLSSEASAQLVGGEKTTKQRTKSVHRRLDRMLVDQQVHQMVDGTQLKHETKNEHNQRVHRGWHEIAQHETNKRVRMKLTGHCLKQQ